MSDSDDDDYQLPSLSERIQTSFKCRNTFKKKPDLKNEKTKSVKSYVRSGFHVKSKSDKLSESDSEESGLLDFSVRIRNTPCSQVKSKSDKLSNSESGESDFLNFSERIQKTPCSQMKSRAKNLDERSDSESEESDFMKFSETISKTPCSSIKSKVPTSSGSEDDSDFLKFSEKIQNTPRTQYGRKLDNEDSKSDSDEVFSNLMMKVQKIRLSKVKKKCNSENSNAFKENSFENRRLSNKDNKDFESEFASLFPARFNDLLFLRKRVLYAQMLYQFFNEKVFNSQLPKDMALIWDGSMLKTAGLTICTYKQKAYGCSIKLSSKLLTSFDRLQDTLIHEMCHAATWMINKKNVCHGPLWQIWASRCKLILPFIDCPGRCHTYDIPYRFWYQCTGCGWRRGACKKTKNYEGALCKRCKLPIIRTVNK